MLLLVFRSLLLLTDTVSFFTSLNAAAAVHDAISGTSVGSA